MITVSLVWFLFCPPASGFVAVRTHDKEQRVTVAAQRATGKAAAKQARAGETAGARAGTKRQGGVRALASALQALTDGKAEPEVADDPLSGEVEADGAGVPPATVDDEVKDGWLSHPWERMTATAIFGLFMLSYPVMMLQAGISRRAFLKQVDEERAAKVLERAKPFVQDGSTAKLWPSEYNGNVKGNIDHPYAEISDEGCMLQYQGEKITRMSSLVLDRDGILYSMNVNVRIIINVGIGIGTSLLTQIIFAQVAEGGAIGKQEKWEIDHVDKGFSAISEVLEPALALFLSFFVSYHISRHNAYVEDACNKMKGSISSYHLMLAAECPQAKHEMLRKTTLRWGLSIWEDAFDNCRMPKDDYKAGKGLDILVQRGLLLPDEVAFLKKSTTGSFGQAMCTWLIGVSKELYNRKEVSLQGHVEMHGYCKDLKSGVSAATTLPIQQYPYIAIHFLNAVVNILTALDAVKCGMDLGEGIQIIRNASWSMLFSDLFNPLLTLLLTPLFFYGALEIGAKLDNPMMEGYGVGRNIMGIPRQHFHQGTRNNSEGFSKVSGWQVEPGSTFAKLFEGS